MLYLKDIKFSCKPCLQVHKAYTCTHVHRIEEGIESIPFLGRGKYKGKRFILTSAKVDANRNRRCAKSQKFRFECDRFCCRGKRPRWVYLDSEISTYEPYTPYFFNFSHPIRISVLLNYLRGRGSEAALALSETRLSSSQNMKLNETDGTISSDEISTDDEIVKTETIPTKEKGSVNSDNHGKPTVDSDPSPSIKVLHDLSDFSELSDISDSNLQNDQGQSQPTASEAKTLKTVLHQLSDFSDVSDISEVSHSKPRPGNNLNVKNSFVLSDFQDDIPLAHYKSGFRPTLPDFSLSYERTRLRQLRFPGDRTILN